MFRDYDRYLSQSLKVYLFVLIIIFIMKLIGLDYFGLHINNSIIINIGNYLGSTKWGDVICFVTICVQLYFYLGIVCNKRKLTDWAVLGGAINYLFQVLLVMFDNMGILYYIISFSIMIFMPMCINKEFFIKKQIKYIIVLTIYQMISLVTRNVNINYEYGNFLVDSILNLDQLLMLGINYNIVIMKGEDIKCQAELEVGLSSLKKINLSILLTKLRKNLHNFKKLDKETKLSYIIYFILSLFWNTMSIILILFVARINDTFIECMFILTSFWLSKRTFGKAFHLSSMTQCFVVSNLTYYTLNRITTPLGISILVPIMLGVGLSYVTSKFVKKFYKPLYKGMPKDVFEETILQVVDKDSVKYKICYDYFINKQSALYLSSKYNYSEAGIRKIKDRVNIEIKKLK